MHFRYLTDQPEHTLRFFCASPTRLNLLAWDVQVDLATRRLTHGRLAKFPCVSDRKLFCVHCHRTGVAVHEHSAKVGQRFGLI